MMDSPTRGGASLTRQPPLPATGQAGGRTYPSTFRSSACCSGDCCWNRCPGCHHRLSRGGRPPRHINRMALGEGGEGSPRRWDEREALVEAATTAGCTLTHPCEDRSRSFVGFPPAGGGWSSGCEILKIVGQDISWRRIEEGSPDKNSAEPVESASHEGQACIIEVISLGKSHGASTSEAGTQDDEPLQNLTPPWSTLKLPSGIQNDTGRGIIASLLKTVAALYKPAADAGAEGKDSDGEANAGRRMGSGVDGGLAALTPRHPSMASLVDIVTVPSGHVLILFRFGKQQCSIRNLVRFSAREMMRDKASALFVTYQILHLLDDSKARGVSFGYLSDAMLLVDDSLWLAVPSLAPALGLGRSLDSSQLRMDLESATRSWVRGSMSNYNYLMLLNCLAGRRMGDPCYHPILPWVANFASRTPEGSEWRDLSRSKLRLTRGDEQLDSTFLGGGASAHHITESLSDLTCHMYLARRTPKHRLVKAVRSRWQPNEYPSSMQRMYEWTPDECIPQFFTDPSIFSSIHEDMPDLQVPRWASGPQDFVAWHRHVLESGLVSSNLHAWIDVTFGYKLNGKAAVEAKNVPLDDLKFPRDRGFAVLFTEPHPCRASSVTEQLGRGPLPAMELDDGRASPQADDTTGQSTKSINSISSTRHHPRAGLAQAEYADSDSSFEPQEDVTAANAGVGGTRPKKGLLAGLRRAIGDRVQDLEAIGRAGAGGVSAGLKAVAGVERGGERVEGKRGGRVEKVGNNNSSDAEGGVADAKKEDWATVLANLEGYDDPNRSIMSISIKEDVEIGLSQLLDDLCEIEATRRCVEETAVNKALDVNQEEEGLWSCGLVAAQLTSGRIADLAPHGGIVAGSHGWELSVDMAGRDGGALSDLIARCTRRSEEREERGGGVELGDGLTEVMRAALQGCRQNIEDIGVDGVVDVSGRASLVRGGVGAGKGLAWSVLGHVVFPAYMPHVHTLYRRFHEGNDLVDAVLSFVRSQSSEEAGIRQEGISLCLPIISSLLSSPQTRVDTLALVAPSLISTMPSKIISPLFLPPLLDELGASGEYIARDGLDAASLTSWLGCLGMSDFISLLLPRVIPLVASQDAAVAKRISDSLVHLASDVLGCVVSVQCIVEPLIALFGKPGSEHAVTAIDAIGTRFGECFCRDALVPRLLSLLPSSAQIDVSVSESDSTQVTNARPPEPPLSSGGIRGLRAELLGRGNKSTPREGEAGRDATDRNMTSLESSSPRARTKGNGGSIAAGGALTADVVQALSNAISCLSPQGALQCLVVDSNLLVRQLSAPMRVQTATTAMLCSNAIARLCARIGPEETRRHILPLLGAWFTSLNQVYGGDFGPGGNPLGLGGTGTVFSPGGSKMSEETREKHKQVHSPQMIYSLYVPVYSLVPPSNVAHTQWRTALRQNIRNHILIEDILKDNFGWTSSSSSAVLQIIPPMLVKHAKEGESWVGPPHKMSRSDNNIVVLGPGGNGNFQGILGRTFKGHTGVLRFCSSDRQERVIITGGRDGTVRVWSPQTSQCAGVYTGHRNTVYWGEVLGVNQTIASCDGEMHVWDAQVLQRLHTLRANLQSGHSAHFTAAHVHSASSGGAAACLMGCAERLPGPVAMKLFDIRTRNRRAELHLPPSINNISAIATEGDWVCLGSVTGQLVVVDLRSGAVREQWEGHDGPVTGIKIRAGSQVVSSSSDRTVAVWNLECSGHGTTARDWERAWESSPISVWGSEQGEGESDQNRLFLTEPVVGLTQMGDRTVAALGQGLVFAEPPHVSESRLRSVKSPVTCVGSMAHSNWVIVGCEDGRSRCLY